MKKIVALVIMAAMLLSLTACGMSRTESSEDHGDEVSINSETLSSVQTSEKESVQLKEGEFRNEPRYYYTKDGTFSVSLYNEWYPILRERDKYIAIDYNLQFDESESDYKDKIGEEYLRIYYKGDWTGREVEYDGHSIRICSGEVYVDGEPTGAKTDERVFVDKVVNFYLNGQWNGENITIDSHEVCIDKECGHLLIDGHLSCIYYMSVDLMGTDLESKYLTSIVTCPEYNYIKGQGTYFIEDGRLIKYHRGEKIVLPGESLNIDLEDNQEIVCLFYDREEDKMYIEIIEDSRSIFLGYVFPDYNVSEVEKL